MKYILLLHKWWPIVYHPLQCNLFVTRCVGVVSFNPSYFWQLKAEVTSLRVLDRCVSSCLSSLRSDHLFEGRVECSSRSPVSPWRRTGRSPRLQGRAPQRHRISARFRLCHRWRTTEQLRPAPTFTHVCRPAQGLCRGCEQAAAAAVNADWFWDNWTLFYLLIWRQKTRRIKDGDQRVVSGKWLQKNPVTALVPNYHIYIALTPTCVYAQKGVHQRTISVCMYVCRNRTLRATVMTS